MSQSQNLNEEASKTTTKVEMEASCAYELLAKVGHQKSKIDFWDSLFLYFLFSSVEGFQLFQSSYSKIDYTLIISVYAIALISVIGITSASHQIITYHPYFFGSRQAIWFIIGSVAMWLTMIMDYRAIAKHWKPLYIGGITLLLLVFLWGTVTNGANSWFQLGPIKAEPGEFMKLIIIVSVANKLAQIEHVMVWKDIRDIFLIMIPPMGLVVLQPDLGMALMMGAIGVGMVWISGIQVRQVILLSSIALTGFGALAGLYYFQPGLFYQIIQPYQWRRLTSFVDPIKVKNSDGYQLFQSLVAISGGHWWGEGLFHGIQTQSAMIPERHTDFIFAVIAEETGFIGVTALLGSYTLLLIRMIRIGQAADRLGAYMVAGVISMFVAQIFENIGMTVSMMPITGITLPLVSYGGSSIVTTMTAIGLVLNVKYRKPPIHF